MNIIKNQISIGLEKPLRVLHISDAHLTPADNRDNARKNELAKNRSLVFEGSDTGKAERALRKLMEYGEKECDIIVNTGDLIDFVSEAACDKLREYVLDRKNLLFAVGNHEFSHYVGEAFEDFEYKMTSYNKIQNSISSNIDFSAKLIGGINFITLDNVYYDFTYKQLLLLREECKKDVPIVLCMHVPIYHEEYFRFKQNGNPTIVTYLCGAPDEAIRSYSPDRFRQQHANEITMEVIEFIRSEPKIKAILAGHTHENYECVFESGLIQLVTTVAFEGAREIEFV